LWINPLSLKRTDLNRKRHLNFLMQKFLLRPRFLCYAPPVPNYRYSCLMCGKTYIGPPQPGMMCNCQPPKPMIGTPYVAPIAPLSAELQVSLSIKEATPRRAQLCQQWGIDNKSHKPHGSNFSGSQTLVQLINNIVEPLVGAERERVRALIITEFSYDIVTQQMT
jgi:hypothetical protein